MIIADETLTDNSFLSWYHYTESKKYLYIFISLELTRVNPDRNRFSINVELTSTFLLYRGLVITITEFEIFKNDDIEFITEFPYLLGHPVNNISSLTLKIPKNDFK